MDIFRGAASRRITLYLTLRPDSGETLGSVLRATAIEKRTALYALDHLVEDRLVTKTDHRDGYPRYAFNRTHPLASDLTDLAIRTFGGRDDLLTRLLRDPAVSRAAIFGSFAAGTVHDTSDIDLLVVLDHESEGWWALSREIEDVGFAMLRPINLISYTEAQFRAGSDFLRETLARPLIVLKGSVA